MQRVKLAAIAVDFDGTIARDDALWCRACPGIEDTRWDVLGQLRLGQAAALPVTREAGGGLRLFEVAPRMADVFGDHPLAATLASIERRHRPGAVPEVVAAIRARDELGDGGREQAAR